MISRTYMTVVAGLAVLSACQTAQPAHQAVLSPDHGRATAENIAAMAIAPTADELNNRYIPADRERAERALRAYRDGNAPELLLQDTGGN